MEGLWPEVTELAERMAEFGVGLAYHHHMGTIVETDCEVGRLMSVTEGSVGLLFDSGHSAFSGGDPCRSLRSPCGAYRPCALFGPSC